MVRGKVIKCAFNEETKGTDLHLNTVRGSCIVSVSEREYDKTVRENDRGLWDCEVGVDDGKIVECSRQ
jgi:hypothetical protein